MLKADRLLLISEPSMFIQTEPTPNPATLKFLPGRTVIASGTANFTEAETAARLSPLAERLFSLPEVTGVFLGADFITVTKDGAGDWYQLKPAILAVIMEHFTAGRPVLLAAVDSAVAEAREEDEDEVVSQIKELLETRVRPAVALELWVLWVLGGEWGLCFSVFFWICRGSFRKLAITLRYRSWGSEGSALH